MIDQLTAFKGLETAVHEIHYLSILWAKMEEATTGGRTNPDGTHSCIYDSYEDACIHSFLGYEIERRTAALRRDFLACFDLSVGGDHGRPAHR